MTNSSTQITGTFYGVGVGPGDPELLTLKAHRLIQQADLVTYLSSESGNAMARTISSVSLDKATNPTQLEHPIVMPMNENRDRINLVYDEAAKVIAKHLDDGKNVVFLCLGDPFFFGSFAYLYDRLNDQYKVETIPGVTAINASVALTGRPIGLLAENSAVISGRREDDDILQTLKQFDNISIMKPGRRRPDLLRLIEQSGRSNDSCYIEYAGQPNEKIVYDISTLDATVSGPYFSLFLISKARNYSPNK
ncbi:MAG: precorrin-2/cobalt-factor-2 C20-methyltransferase [Gammaproteobacteria bacterium]|jgi:precorrin-2/cobalt-factor-2 C20-methyltransferase